MLLLSRTCARRQVRRRETLEAVISTTLMFHTTDSIRHMTEGYDARNESVSSLKHISGADVVRSLG